MAITIVEQPYQVAPAHQQLKVISTSDNSSEDGFRILHIIEINSDSVNAISVWGYPNAAGTIILDVSELLKTRLYNLFGTGSIHSTVGDDLLFEEDVATGSLQYDVTLTEYWIVSGVLTENVGSAEDTGDLYVWTARYNKSSGYRPNPLNEYNNAGNKNRFLSDRFFDTIRWKWQETFGFTPEASILIPSFETDWGVLSWIEANVSLPSFKIRITLYDSSNAPHTYTSDAYSPGSGALLNLAVYPANLNSSDVVGLVIPYDYPNWICYTVQMIRADTSAAMSAPYLFYNAALWGQKDCELDYVRVAWQAHTRGGWDYYNFIKKSEKSYPIERKRFNQISGTYAAATYTDNAMSGGLTERAIIADEVLLVTSDWIQENEFAFLRSLLMSEQVHIVNQSGTHIPVVIEASDYVEKKAPNGKLVNLDLKLKYANGLTI